MAKILSVYNRLQAGDYENGNGGKRRVSRLTQFIHATLRFRSMNHHSHDKLLCNVSVWQCKHRGDIMNHMAPLASNGHEVISQSSATGCSHCAVRL